jgi:hypothetical protein
MRSNSLHWLVPMCVLGACGGGGGHDVEPRVIPGGGVGDADIDGEVNVFVIDDDTDDPVSGADVYLGEELMGSTDADGLLVIEGDFSGPQDITVIATDYVTSTWFGANGANVTVPMSIADPPTPQVDTATLTGTIAGWDGMQPPQGQVLVAFVGYSATNIDEDPANELVQPGAPDSPNQCVKTDGGNEPCAWSLLTRTGPQAVYAFIGNIDFAAQPVPTLEITGFAFVEGLEVQDGVDQNNITLDVVSGLDLESADVGLPSAPAGTDTTAALARFNLGDDGRVQLPVSGGLGTDIEIVSIQIPKTSAFASATVDLIGFASNAADEGAQSVRIDRDVGSLDNTSVGAFLDLPGDVATAESTFSFAPVDGASVHTLAVSDTGDIDAWGAVILDERVEVTKPAIAELPQGSLTFTAQAIELPDFDPEDFSLDNIADTVTRVSADSADFTH